MILESQMKRRFSESRIMTEYHMRKPYFITENDDLYSASPLSSTPCDEIWKKFELYSTPPNSPRRQDNTGIDGPPPNLVPLEANGTLSPENNLDDSECLDLQWTPTYATQDDFSPLSDIVYADIDACLCSNEDSLIKDCMWNGVGHKASTALRKAHNRTASPHVLTNCPPNGCVDPRHIFPFPVGLTPATEHKKQQTGLNKSPQKPFKSSVDGAEAHSDSASSFPISTPSSDENMNNVYFNFLFNLSPDEGAEIRKLVKNKEDKAVELKKEEIDVVTVEKNQSTPTLKPKNTVAPKIVAAFVPKENGKLAIVTSGGASLTTKGIVKTIAQGGEVERGRTKNKYHVFTSPSSSSSSNGNKTSSSVAVAVESKPSSNDFTLFSTTNLASKRRHTTAETRNLMKMANPKLVMQRGEDSVSPVARYSKKRVLSLEGVSFCATPKSRLNDPTMTGIPKIVEVQGNSAILQAANSALAGNFTIARPKSNMTPIEIKEETDACVNNQNSVSPPCKRRRKADAIVRLLPAGNGSDSEQIRAAHNVLERQRREGLRTLFNTLRENVPELQRQEKAPKVHILNKSRDYCQELQKTEKNLIAEKERLAKRNQRLMERLDSAKISYQLIHRDSDIESDNEESSSARSGDSPLSSLPPSLPPSPQLLAAGEYFIARRVSQDNASSPQEVLLRLEPPLNAKNGKINTDYISSLKQGSSQTGLRAFLTPLSAKSQDGTNSSLLLPSSEGLSDGFEYLSEEEAALP